MKTNLIPSLVIAAAILGAAYLVTRESTSAVTAFFDDLEEVTGAKDADGKNRVGRIVEEFSGTLVESFKAGISSGRAEEVEALAVIEQLVVKDVVIVPGSNKTEERVVGLVRNDSAEMISDVRFSVIFKDADGRLMDVTTSSDGVKGVLKPGAERGFEVKRDLGDFDEKADVLKARKATAAEVSVTGLRVVR